MNRRYVPYLGVLGILVIIFVIYHSQNAAHFPGFTKVADKNGAADLYVDLTSIKLERRDSGYGEDTASFRMINLIGDDYAIHAATTDCHSDDSSRDGQNFRSFDGIKYKKDGTADGNYAGSTYSISIDSKQDIVLSDLVKLVCGKIEEKRQIHDPFDDAKALEILYGEYHPDIKAALWKDMDSSQLPIGQESFGKNGGWARTLLSQEFIEHNETKKVLVTYTIPNASDYPYECHACAPLLGVVIFLKKDGVWHVERQNRYLGFWGSYGRPSEVKWAQYGKEHYGLLVSDTYMAQGESSFSIDLVGSETAGWLPVLKLEGDGGSPKLNIKEDPNAEFYNITVMREANNEGGSASPSETEYHFQNGRYEIYQNTSPSSVSSSVETPTEQSPAQQPPTPQISETTKWSLPYPQGLEHVITLADWSKVQQALSFAYSLGKGSDVVRWSNPKTRVSGIVKQSGTGADRDGCRQYKVVNTSRSGSPMGYIEVCPNGKYK